MNPKRKAFLEQQRVREEQIRRRAAEQSAAPAMRRVEVLDRPVHDGHGGKYHSGDVVTETPETSKAIDAWLSKGWARLT